MILRNSFWPQHEGETGSWEQNQVHGKPPPSGGPCCLARNGPPFPIGTQTHFAVSNKTLNDEPGLQAKSAPHPRWKLAVSIFFL